MMKITKAIAHKIAGSLRSGDTTPKDPIQFFHSDHYLRHTARRLEHLASLQIPVRGKTVLEVGAGIGDHSSYYIDRGCKITITEDRTENLSILRRRYPDQIVQHLDLENPVALDGATFAIIHCYGLLYHLRNPEGALKFLSSVCDGKLFLETCVSFGDVAAINNVPEEQANPTQATSGTGCRPTRTWLFELLSQLFEHVYVPKTQPNHEEFPLNWTTSKVLRGQLSRAIFIASRDEIDNEILLPALPPFQERHA
jgi:hypothetical protein